MNEKELQTLLDRQSITDSIYQYCRSVDRLDAKLGRSIWHEDSYADYGKTHYQGDGKGVIDWIIVRHRFLAAHSHQVSNILINVDGDTAGSESYYHATLRFKLVRFVRQIGIWGRYVDSWSRKNGRWGIDKRIAIIDFDELSKAKEMTRPKISRRNNSDPSYAALPQI